MTLLTAESKQSPKTNQKILQQAILGTSRQILGQKGGPAATGAQQGLVPWKNDRVQCSVY